MRLEQAEGGGVDLGEQAQLRQVAAGQGEVVLVVELTQPADALDAGLVAHRAADGITGIGGIHHHPRPCG